MFEEVWESLRNPSPPLPTLHRETEVDPKTILQEIIAYPDEPRFVVGMEICEIFVSELIG